LKSANSERVLVTVQAGASKQLQHYEDQGNSLARVEATLESLHTKIEQSSSTQEVLAEILGNFRQVTSEMNLGAKTNYPTPSLTTSDFKRRDARMKFDAERGMKSPRFTKTCRKACQCACHRDSSKRSSGFMYLQFSGLSFSYGRALCDMHACENSRGSFVSVSYCLPRWIASRNLSFWIGYSSLHGMNQSLKIRRMVSSSSPIAQAVIEGSLESFDKLVARGEGSPHDVDEFGDSFLTVCGEWLFPLAFNRRLTLQRIESSPFLWT